MSRTGTALMTAAVLAAAAVGATWAPVVDGQVRVRTSRPERARVVELLGQSGRIGVSVRDVDQETAGEGKQATAGVRIEAVQPDSAAARAGFREGDLVVEFDGERVRSARQFTRLVQESVPGRAVQAVVLRDGQRTAVEVEPESGGAFQYLSDRFGDLMPAPPAPPAPPAAPSTPAPPAPPDPLWRFEGLLGSAGRLGITVQDLSPQLGEYFGVKDGVLVTSVSAGSAAEKAGVKAGDVITALDGAEVSSTADLRRRAQRLEDGAEFTLSITRDKKPLTVKGKAEPRPSRRWTTTI
ncbi:MAG TPA: PDZ domain-containing protein [Vicinamibacterales bacterium]|nr:PDZ domain-containing protein [Vicinamibacterales bacterium]